MAKSQEQGKYTLPVREIKKDLIKTSLYSVFSLLVIGISYYYLPQTPVYSLIDKLIK